MAPATVGYPARRKLARAGWSILSSPSSKSLLESPLRVEAPPAPELEAEGARLVAEVATRWSRKYLHTIRHSGAADGAFHYECLFSCPLQEAPVPGVVISVRFALVAGGEAASRPRLLFSFEEGDLRHEWALARDLEGRLRILAGQQDGSLRDGVFERYLDSWIREKETVRARGVKLATPFEASRLKPPAPCKPQEDVLAELTRESSEVEAQDLEAVRQLSVSQASAGQETSLSNSLPRGGDAGQASPPVALPELLANVFDSADEEGEGGLSHHEVARLLGATLPGFDLEVWDIHLLLTTAQENDDGFIETKTFLQGAPEMIQALRKRRLAYTAAGLPGVEIPVEAIEHCFGEEVLETAGELTKAFEQCSKEDPSRGLFHHVQQAPILRKRTTLFAGAAQGGDSRRPSSVAPHTPAGGDSMLSPQMAGDGREEEELVGLRRRYCRECALTLPERLGPQEVQMLLQMLPEDEDGFVHIEDLAERLKNLRKEALLNALVETDVLSLRTHLVLRFRALGISEQGTMKLWVVRKALLGANEVCLSRLQIHVLLCLSDPDDKGDVDLATYLGILCALIPHMCNAKTFVETAERLQAEHEEARRQKVNAELAMLGAAKVNSLGQDDEEQSKEPVVDQVTVERALIQAFSLSEESHRGEKTLPPEAVFRILRSSDAQVQSCQLSEFEVSGFAAEMNIDARGEVAYVDLVRRWVPIIFELRKHPLLSAYLKDKAAETLGIPEPDLEKLEALYPLMADDAKVVRRRSKSVNTMARHSSRTVERRASAGSVGSFAPSRGQTLEHGASIEESPNRRTPSNTSPARLRGSAAPHSTGPRDPMEPPLGRGYQRRKALLRAQSTPKI